MSDPSTTNQSDPNTTWTILRLLEWTTEYFRNRGSESPRLDAEILLAHARQCERIELYTAFAEELDDQQREAFRELVRRRGEGMPVAQLVGYREFYSLRFRVNEDVLVPRPETEHVVIEALDQAALMQPEDRPLEVADVGTGSGVIGITIAKQCLRAHVTAVDISPAAIKIARWNAEQLGVADRVNVLVSDLMQAIEQPQQFDLICSNPPYVSESEYQQLPASVRDYEPKEALLAGPSGAETIERIVAESIPRLKAGGRLIVELSPMIAEACEGFVNESQGFEDVRLIRDLAGHQRVLSARRRP